MAVSWLINGGDPNHVLSGMILQVSGSQNEKVALIWETIRLPFWESVSFQQTLNFPGVASFFGDGGMVP